MVKARIAAFSALMLVVGGLAVVVCGGRYVLVVGEVLGVYGVK
jgi:hypothetical protein